MVGSPCEICRAGDCGVDTLDASLRTCISVLSLQSGCSYALTRRNILMLVIQGLATGIRYVVAIV